MNYGLLIKVKNESEPFVVAPPPPLCLLLHLSFKAFCSSTATGNSSIVYCEQLEG